MLRILFYILVKTKLYNLIIENVENVENVENIV